MSTRVSDICIFRGVNQCYTYIVPDHLTDDIHIGDHVLVPLGRTSCKGVVIKAYDTNTPSKRLKAILEKQSDIPPLSEEFTHLIQRFSTYYRTTPYKTYQTIVGKRKFRPWGDEPRNLTINPSPFTLNPEQQKTVETISSFSSLSKHLVHGITGSGKTEIYMRLAEHILAQNKSIIICCPEISLTPQYMAHFKDRFNDHVTMIHSGLTPKQRDIAWSLIYEGKSRVIIGPRSAIFSPVHNLGMVIIDEEHDGSYKQDSHPRYYTHTIARWRCEFANCPLVLGSATPSVETYTRAKTNPDTSSPSTYSYLASRATGSTLPTVDIIDMNNVNVSDIGSLSQPLIKHIAHRLEKKQKVIILLNRRGFAPHISCQSCGKVHVCQECQLSFTYHHDKTFRCHRCDITTPVTHTCLHCKKPRLSFAGAAIQKTEAACRDLFPDANIIRLDKDTAATARMMESTINEFKKNGDILIGTQLISKGHHIEDVTLVGVLGIDTVLNLPDYRSSERAFQLTMQVAGRAGRGTLPGHVVIQTYQPEHHAIECAKHHSYDDFITEESEYRQAMHYPPFGELTHVILSCPDSSCLKKYAQTLQLFIHKQTDLITSLQIMGPKPAPIEKVRNHWRYHLLIKHTQNDTPLVQELLNRFPEPPQNIRVIPDIDPLQLL